MQMRDGQMTSSAAMPMMGNMMPGMMPMMGGMMPIVWMRDLLGMSDDLEGWRQSV